MKEKMEFLKKAFKEIDDCPYICHKVTWLQSLFGITISDADAMKLKLNERLI